MAILFANNAVSTLAGAITNTSTVANLAPGTGALFPTIANPGDYFTLTFQSATIPGLNEIAQVTAISGDQVTIIRGRENTTALNWNAGDFASNLVTAGWFQALAQLIPSGYPNTRIITLSGVFVLNTNDNQIGLARAVSPSVSSTNLPTQTNIGQSYIIQDLIGNFAAFPCTVIPPQGHTIAQETQIVLNVNRQRGVFTYYGSNVWGVSL